MRVVSFYPCPNCQFLNMPSHQYCSACGRILLNWASWDMYNIFYKKKNDILYKILLTGGPMFTLEDAWDAARIYIPENHGRLEFFIGKYPVKTNFKGPYVSVKEWYQIDFRATQGNMGSKVIRIS